MVLLLVLATLPNVEACGRGGEKKSWAGKGEGGRGTKDAAAAERAELSLTARWTSVMGKKGAGGSPSPIEAGRWRRPPSAAAREEAWLARGEVGVPAPLRRTLPRPVASCSRSSSPASRLTSLSRPPSDDVSEPLVSGKGSPGLLRMRAGGSGEPVLLEGYDPRLGSSSWPDEERRW